MLSKERKREAVRETKENPPNAGGKTNCLGAQTKQRRG
jgi:hypothetical protein